MLMPGAHSTVAKRFEFARGLEEATSFTARRCDERGAGLL
jgi:hypothetical protein